MIEEKHLDRAIISNARYQSSIRRRNQETPNITFTRINRRKNVRKTEKLVTPPVMQTAIW
jgi:hypothetical protein